MFLMFNISKTELSVNIDKKKSNFIKIAMNIMLEIMS